MRDKPLTRRRLLHFWAVGGGSVLLAACSNQSAPTPTSPPASPTAAALAPTAPPTTAATTAPTIAATPAPTAPPQPTTAPTTAATAQSAHTQTITAMAQAVTTFLDGLNEEQRLRVVFAFDDAERLNWHWIPRSRNGIAFRDLDEQQRSLSLDVLRTGLSEGGAQKALDIIELQDVELSRDPQAYFFSVFGTPGAAEAWGWRFEGNHLSMNYAIIGERVTITPMFLGVTPTTGRVGRFTDVRLMDREENAARELLLSLEDRTRTAAIFRPNALTNLATTTQRRITPLDPVGISVGDLSPEQMRLVSEIIDTYTGTMPAGVATEQREKIRAAGMETIQFGWAGSAEPGQPHYYRLQGPTFLLEFDNSRDSGRHIHSVWRDFVDDFGAV